MKQWEFNSIFTKNMSKLCLFMSEQNYYPQIESVYHSKNGLVFNMFTHSPNGILLEKPDDYKQFGKQWCGFHPLNKWDENKPFVFEMNIEHID